VNHSSSLVTKDELKGKVKDEVQSLKREIEEMHKATAEVHGKLQKKLTEVLEGDFEEVFNNNNRMIMIIKKREEKR
jgi:NifU-like protein involved in Fe-S cluster formation